MLFLQAYYLLLVSCLGLYIAFPMAHYQEVSSNLLVMLISAPVLVFFAVSSVPIVSLTRWNFSTKQVSSIVRYIYAFWIGLTILEIATQGTLPIFSLGFNNYGEWGTKGLGGFMNAIALLLLPYLSFSDRLSRSSRIIGVGSILLYQVLTVRRGHLVFFICYLVATYFYLNQIKISVKNIVPFILGVIVLIIVFGIIGDSRGEYANPFLSLFDERTKGLLALLPSGFTWVLVYFTSPLGNLNSAWADTCADEFSPILSLFPSPLRSFFSGQYSVLNCSIDLDNPALNVSTGFLTFKQAGWFASFYLSIVIYGMFVASSLYKRTKEKNIFASAAMALCLMTILTSFFSNFFFLPTYFIAFILLLFFASNTLTATSCLAIGRKSLK
ncbi:O-antigen polymerase [Cyanobium sp. ATX 6F1]|uniref:O-antigen polymerase n=1 Tax=unclassified Cyanobium TaxID=2627006 RepID=UPI0020CFDFE2|nr:O-antigen polymerase [Cyanobium sp. ATX 6F1]MCP9916643.1 oligosaccharide repeat unit polymerase [Cyanobium sp. ATX 6F1]